MTLSQPTNAGRDQTRLNLYERKNQENGGRDSLVILGTFNGGGVFASARKYDRMWSNSGRHGNNLQV
jgi:hypothetical protein